MEGKNKYSKEAYLKRCGKSFRYYRREFDYTQKEFAHRCGVHQQTISNFERGIPISGYSTLKILSCLNCLMFEYEKECEYFDPTSGLERLKNITFKRS